MSNQQLGKCRMLPYEVWPNLLLQSLVHIDSVYNNPKGIVNLLCWCLVSFFWKEPGLALPRFKQWPISAAINEAPCPLVIFNTTTQWHGASRSWISQPHLSNASAFLQRKLHCITFWSQIFPMWNHLFISFVL